MTNMYVIHLLDSCTEIHEYFVGAEIQRLCWSNLLSDQTIPPISRGGSHKAVVKKYDALMRPQTLVAARPATGLLSPKSSHVA
jgi:hypothetical protein